MALASILVQRPVLDMMLKLSVILLNIGNRSFKVMNEQTINPYGGLEQPLTNIEGFTAVKKKNPRFK
jgi:hypothetical protein